eukprot:TRINITY_DN10701_c2_g1_i1.p1 TRINITY_DN10701_c2_g1~~TRINITY_DN10701_c2_g1_i1.p1  ORF type:complete len:201 (+),score=59.82 TRINITY_DN10701_c2_g1_i1:47-604(+)
MAATACPPAAAVPFDEREEILKERFLELDGGESDADAWTGAPVFSIEDDDERRERERREYMERCELEDLQEEHRAIQEIYKRASTRAFRRLKNLPEPIPGCHYTGDGEDEGESEADYTTVARCYPGDGEESADELGAGQQVAPLPLYPTHPQYGRLRRRRHRPPSPGPSSQGSFSAPVMAEDATP